MKSNKSTAILIFSDWYLPGYKAGGPISSLANLVEAFGDQIKFKIICGDRDYLDTAPYPLVEGGQWIRNGKAEVYYLPEHLHSYKTIKRLIREERPSAVYINGMFSKVFSIFPLRAAKRLGCRTIVAPRGMLAPGALGLKSGKKNLFLRFANTTGMYRNVVFHATNAHESVHIRNAIHDSVRILEIPNVPKMGQSEIKRTKPKGYLNVLIIARIAPEKNIEFALNCLAKLPTHLQVDVKFIGPVYDKDYFAKCTSVMKKNPANVKISWEGSKTPAEIPPYIAKAHLFFLPTLGENYGHAILESMLSGLPVLISDQTPWRDLESKAFGKDASLNQMQEFVDFISELAEMDSEDYNSLYHGLGQRATALVDIQKIEQGYKALFT